MSSSVRGILQIHNVRRVVALPVFKWTYFRQWNMRGLQKRYTFSQSAGLLNNYHILWTKILEGKCMGKYFVLLWSTFTLSDAGEFYALFSTAKSVSYGPQNMAIQKILTGNYYCIQLLILLHELKKSLWFPHGKWLIMPTLINSTVHVTVKKTCILLSSAHLARF